MNYRIVLVGAAESTRYRKRNIVEAFLLQNTCGDIYLSIRNHQTPAASGTGDHQAASGMCSPQVWND
jgi:hypothetical protein